MPGFQVGSVTVEVLDGVHELEGIRLNERRQLHDATRGNAVLANPPRGNELPIASDGAVGPLINETRRLLGYVGEEPADQLVRGFLTPHLYKHLDGQIVDFDSRATVEDQVTEELKPAAQAVAARASTVELGALLRVTTHGDLVVFGESGIEQLTSVLPREWFPGHLNG